MCLLSDHFAPGEVLAVGLGIRHLYQVRRDRSSVVFPEAFTDVVPGGADLGLVKLIRVLDKLLHPVAVWGQNLRNVRLRPLRLAEPPDSVDGILDPHLPFVDPLDGTRKLRRIEPIEVLREEEAQLIDHPDQHAEVVEAPNRGALHVGPAEVHDEAAVIGQLLPDQRGEFQEPVHILVLFKVPVSLLALEGERGASHYEVHAAARQLREKFSGITYVGGSIGRGVGGVDVAQLHNCYL